MTTPNTPPVLRPVAEVEPVVLADGVRVYRHVEAHGDDLLKLGGSLDKTNWIDRMKLSSINA